MVTAAKNVGVVRQVIAAQHSGDLEGAIDTAVRASDPELEFTSVLASVEGATYRGYDGVRRYFNDLDSSFAQWRNELEEISEIRPDILLGRLRFRAVGRGSGAAVGVISFVVFVLSSGKLRGIHSYPSRDEALDAARRMQ